MPTQLRQAQKTLCLRAFVVSFFSGPFATLSTGAIPERSSGLPCAFVYITNRSASCCDNPKKCQHQVCFQSFNLLLLQGDGFVGFGGLCFDMTYYPLLLCPVWVTTPDQKTYGHKTSGVKSASLWTAGGNALWNGPEIGQFPGENVYDDEPTQAFQVSH